MSFKKLIKIPVRLISRSSALAKIPSLGTLGKKENLNIEEKVKVPVESNPQRLVEYVCGSNLLIEGGEDIKVKPDSEYPEWLWSIPLGTLGKKENLNIEEKVKVPVESNPQRLVEYVCGSNLLIEGGEDKS